LGDFSLAEAIPDWGPTVQLHAVLEWTIEHIEKKLMAEGC
jgi:hypothetical protein